MSMICATPDGQLAIDGVSMHTPAWNVLTVVELWMPGNQRGLDRLLPLTPGVQAHQRRLTVTRHSLPMVIVGEVDENGDPNADLWAGLEANVATLHASVVAPTGVGDGTRAATLTMPSGAVRNADIHVEGLAAGRTIEGTNQSTGLPGVLMLATLEISIPAGEFA